MAFPTHSERLPKEEGKRIINEGTRLGESEPSKGSVWAGYGCDGKHYISLDDEYDMVWETTYEVMKQHCL